MALYKSSRNSEAHSRAYGYSQNSRWTGWPSLCSLRHGWKSSGTQGLPISVAYGYSMIFKLLLHETEPVSYLLNFFDGFDRRFLTCVQAAEQVYPHIIKFLDHHDSWQMTSIECYQFLFFGTSQPYKYRLLHPIFVKDYNKIGYRSPQTIEKYLGEFQNKVILDTT